MLVSPGLNVMFRRQPSVTKPRTAKQQNAKSTEPRSQRNRRVCSITF